jgi:hypothetical protein
MDARSWFAHFSKGVSDKNKVANRFDVGLVWSEHGIKGSFPFAGDFL